MREFRGKAIDYEFEVVAPGLDVSSDKVFSSRNKQGRRSGVEDSHLGPYNRWSGCVAIFLFYDHVSPVSVAHFHGYSLYAMLSFSIY